MAMRRATTIHTHARTHAHARARARHDALDKGIVYLHFRQQQQPGQADQNMALYFWLGVHIVMTGPLSSFQKESWVQQAGRQEQGNGEGKGKKTWLDQGSVINVDLSCWFWWSPLLLVGSLGWVGFFRLVSCLVVGFGRDFNGRERGGKRDQCGGFSNLPHSWVVLLLGSGCEEGSLLEASWLGDGDFRNAGKVLDDRDIDQ
jgi:hypothetical protein